MQRLWLDQRLAERKALSQEQGVGHRAPDENAVAPLHQAMEKLDLPGNLGPSDDCDKGPLRVTSQDTENIQLGFHKQASHGRMKEPDHSHRGCMCPVHGAERIVDEEIAELRESTGETLIVPRLASEESDVLEEKNRVRAEGVTGTHRLGRIRRTHQMHSYTEHAPQLIGFWSQAQTRIEDSMRTTKVGDENGPTRPIQQKTQRGTTRFDSGSVRHPTVFERDVIIYPDQRPPTPQFLCEQFSKRALHAPRRRF